jgi:hypothetical protein
MRISTAATAHNTISLQSTVNSQQPTANSQQSTVLSPQEQEAFGKLIKAQKLTKQNLDLKLTRCVCCCHTIRVVKCFLQLAFLNAQVVDGIGGSEAGEHHLSLRAQTAVYAKHNDKRRGS